jgi:PAS domain S-box-containing protein
MTTSSFNFQLPGYQIVEELYRDAKTIVYRAKCVDDKLGEDAHSVAIKVLSSAYPSDRDLLEFRHQYAITKNLDLPGVVRHYSLEEYEGGYALVMEDWGGISLAGYSHNNRLLLSDVLNMAIELADTLHDLGQQRIIHKDIKPANILIHPVTKQVKLIDFSIASLLPRETQEIIDPHRLEGTLAYLSPEQTGRMNRGIDYRTDFYALGVTLYELLTGKLPFVAEDSMELIHCHLAQIAMPIHLVNTDIPFVISQLVAKLMAKNVEDRYQTARGIRYDLERCLEQYLEGQIDAKFELGDRDISDKFLIPERLYGRESEVKVLLDAFARVSVGGSELLLVAGHSGIGKTAIVNEIHKPIVQQRGYFIRGKFDQFNRDLPFSGFVQSLRDLVGQLLSESDLQLANWKSQILAAIGENGRILIDIIPSLEKIIGPQPPVNELVGMTAQIRFNWLFQKFVEVFTTVEHPLAIFLDDLQWADSASLHTIELLMRGNGYLLLLGVYRDNEVSSAHPLMLMLEKLQQANRNVSKITLAPLTFIDTNRLVADTFCCTIDRAKPLTESIDLKAHGNPLFITQFLKALYADGEIWFNPDGYWECDILKIQSLAITDDVVEFIAIQIQKLPLATQDILKLAACIGDRFDLEVLSIVSEQSQLVTTAVWNGLQAGLILPTSQVYKLYQDLRDLQDGVVGVNRVFQLPAANSTYRFLHDRVQQAAYSLIPAHQRQQTHLQIGRLLLAKTTQEQQSERLFEIVNHFNIATVLIEQPTERVKLAQLNLYAAQKARVSNAYVAAYEYARIGVEILAKSGWIQQYHLTLALHDTLADAAFLTGEFGAIPKLFQTILDRSRTPLDRVKSYETIIRFHAIQKQYSQAISRGLEILQQLGIKLSPQPDRLVLLRELALTKIALWGKSNDRLLNLPEIVAPEKIAPLRILDLLQAPAFFCSQELMAVLSLVGIRLTLRDGNTPWAAAFYSVYCILNSGLGELNKAYRFSQLTMLLADRFVDLSVTTRVQVIAAWYANPWHEPLRTVIPLLERSIDTAIESSNLQYIGLNAGVSIGIRFFVGIPLAEIVDLIPKIIELVTQSNDENSQQLFELTRQTIFNFCVPSNQPTEILKGQEKLSLIARWQANNEALILSNMYGLQTFLAYHFEDIPNALIYADAQLPYEHAAISGYGITQIWTFDALTRLAAYPQRNKRVQKQLLDRVKNTQRQLGKRARSMPANFQHQYDLVAAEKCRVLGDFATAIELYDRAISSAKTHEFIQEEALANELAAKFYLQWDKEKIAAVYMQSAYYCYLRWGARAKTALLEQRYPHLLAPILQAQQTEFNPLVTLAKITNSAGKYHPNISGTTFDLASVIQSAQALSSTIELEQLIQQLSRIILQNSGAETCILALPDLQDEWQIRRSSLVERESLTIQTPPTISNSIEYPANLIYWIKNTQKSLIFDARQPLEIADLYLIKHQPPSVFCLPIVKQAKVLGVLYLEHRHTPDIFTDNSKNVISFLCNQAAIAIDNANLYRQAQAAADNAKIQQSYLEALLNNIPHMTWLKDADSRFIAVNQACAAISGRDRIEFIGKTDLDFWPIELAQKYRDDDLFVMASGNRQVAEEKTVTINGHDRWLETIKTPILNNQGEITGTAGIALDITDRKLMEIALRESEQRYHQLVSNIPAALYQFELTTDGTPRMNYVSERFPELFGVSAVAVLADVRVLFDLVIPEDRSSLNTTLHHSAATGEAWTWDGRVFLPSGQIKWIQGESQATQTATGSIVWDGILMDVTDRKQAEIDLLASKQFLQTVLDSFPLFIFWKDRHSVYLGSNQKFITGAGLQDSIDLIGKTDYDLHWEPAESTAYRADDLEVIETETAKLGIIETQLQLDGSLRWLETNKVPLRNPEGEIMGVVGTYQDVTERQQAQLDLNLTNERLELTITELQQATRLKDEFLATMSHELRTPLNAILGMSEVLQEEIFGSLNPRQLDAISTIEQSGEHLLSLITDILDVSKIAAGKLELNLTQISLADLCKSSLILVKQQASAKQIQIDTHLPADPDLLLLDERRMRQVLINLLNNAVKFTHHGGLVKLAVSIEPAQITDRTAGYSICFAISDTGIGIASADIAKLFQPFIQIDSSLNRKYEGTGLGLVLVKQIVELHGGTVSIDSTVGTGSCFTVKLPQLSTLSQSPTIPVALSPLILLVEANEVTVNTFSSYLIAKGYRIILAQTGRSAIALTHSHHPDLILMDIHSSDLEYIKTIASIRKQFVNLPIIAISASPTEGERNQCLARGANKYLTKPVKLRKLQDTIQACLDLGDAPCQTRHLE